MPLIDYIREEDLPADLEDVFADSAYGDDEDRHLFYEMLANNPGLLRARVQYFKQLMQAGTIDERLKELLYVAVSVENDCKFAAATHSRYLVELHDEPESTVAAVVRGDFDDLDERDAAAVAFGQKATRNPNDVDKADIARLKAAGFDDGQIIELLVLLSEFSLSNTVINALNMELSDRGDSPPAFFPE